MKSKILFYFVFLLSITISFTSADELKIKLKIENEIITNYDISDEINYLISLNNNLKKLSKKQIKILANESSIKDKIKYIELNKYFDLNKKDANLEKIILKNLKYRLKKNSKEQLKLYFKEYKLEYDYIINKLYVEFLWNKLIYEKYISKVSLNEKELENKIKNIIQNKAGIEELNLMEIVFDLKNNENANDKYNEILKTINEKGFENAANIFSVSTTAKFGGEVGWIKTTQLSDNVIEKLSGLEINKVSKPIQIGNNYIVLKIKEKKIVKENINLEAELNKLKQQETDRQLNQYSLIYFNKVKKGIFINEL
tara:strand:+ start:334 stop:1269 length:936 start_codon:yes stop_codon:yes gene_type:complete